MILVIYLIALFVSLFILFSISRHDFVLLRQNINLSQVFDRAFIIVLISFIVARLGFIFYFEKFELFNPLRFLYLTKYWGIIPYLGFISMIAIVYFLFRKKKNILRIFDIYFISFSPLIISDIMLKSNDGYNLLIKAVSILVLSLFYFWFIKIHNKYTLKDGFMTSIIFISYSLVTLAFLYLNVGFLNAKYIWFQAIIIFSIVCSAVMLFLVQKKQLNK